MHDSKHFTAGQGSEGHPAFLAVNNAVTHTTGERVLKDGLCQLETYVVLRSIGLRFPEVPFETHSYNPVVIHMPLHQGPEFVKCLPATRVADL